MESHADVCDCGAARVSYPSASEPTVAELTCTGDTRMRAKRLVTLGVLIAGLAFANATPARSQNVSDETGPAISNVTFSTTSVDTSSGPKNVTVTVSGTDDLSGVNYIWLYLRTTATSQPANQTSVNC